MSVKVLSPSKAYEQIESMFGSEIIHPEEVSEIDIIKTGSPSLDRALAVGGWPRGRMIQLAGKEASGKTFLSMKAIADWQAIDPENCACFIDAEYTYDPKWAESIGVDNDRVILVKTNEAAKIVTGLIGTVKTNKQSGKTVITPGILEMAAEGKTITKKTLTGRVLEFNLAKLGIVVIDSIAAMVTPVEIESAVGKQNIALTARFLANELKKLTPYISDSNVAFFVINQVRVNVGQMFGNPESNPGGKSLKHACSVMVNVAPLGGKDNQIFDDKDERIGHKIRAKIAKNKVGAAFKNADFTLKFDEGIVDVNEELLELYKHLDLVKRPNNRTYIFGNHTLTSKADAQKFVSLNFNYLEEVLRRNYILDEEISFEGLIGIDDIPLASDKDVIETATISDVDELF